MYSRNFLSLGNDSNSITSHWMHPAAISLVPILSNKVRPVLGRPRAKTGTGKSQGVTQQLVHLLPSWISIAAFGRCYENRRTSHWTLRASGAFILAPEILSEFPPSKFSLYLIIIIAIRFSFHSSQR